MKNKALQKLLAEFPDDLEVTITDGYKERYYHTDGLEVEEFQLDRKSKKVLDIGIGGHDNKGLDIFKNN